ncbi:hypothetical protein VNO78_32690 [Psophocarpus tetragonolobus]|uniref:Uncharacterized protein n=1 Tax=Psophocarpus tetragonolobus TaxID=3891 RepID=A0AAN9P2X9_PSOTE
MLQSEIVFLEILERNLYIPSFQLGLANSEVTRGSSYFELNKGIPPLAAVLEAAESAPSYTIGFNKILRWGDAMRQTWGLDLHLC